MQTYVMHTNVYNTYIYNVWFLCVAYLYFLKKILFIHSWETHTERGRDIVRGRSRLPAGSPTWDLIPGSWDHALSRRQMLNYWATQASHIYTYVYKKWMTAIIQGVGKEELGLFCYKILLLPMKQYSVCYLKVDLNWL